jgi:hypothetical protein
MLKRTFGVCKVLGNSSVAEQLTASQEGLTYLELVIFSNEPWTPKRGPY